MTTYNYLEQTYKRDLETLRADDSCMLTSDVKEDLEHAERYAFGSDAVHTVRTWNLLTEDTIPFRGNSAR